MTTSDKGMENESNPDPKKDRLEEIKKEEKEDASSYYGQGSEKDSHDEEAEFSKPMAEVDKDQEEMSLLKAVAFLGFGLAVLAIIFILFFIRDLDDRVGNMDSTVNQLEEKFAPLKKEVKDSIDKVNQDISGLLTKVGTMERKAAIMELKRALVAVQAMTVEGGAEMLSKTGNVVASIESLLREFGVDTGPASPAPAAGTIQIEEAPVSGVPEFEAPPLEEAPVAEEAPHAASEMDPSVAEETIEPVLEIEELAEEAEEESGEEEGVEEAVEESDEGSEDEGGDEESGEEEEEE